MTKATARRFAHWVRQRNPNYVAARLVVLLRRYGLRSAAPQKRVLDGVNLLARHGCSPTFPTPGRVVENNADFCREVQRLGAELSVHGYDHVDFRGLSPAERKQQFRRASRAFEECGIKVDGFRLPYLGYSDEVLQSVPGGMFSYSSNKAIYWDVVSHELTNGATATFQNLCRFYQPQSADCMLAVPRMTAGLVEIPASLPDDLQLFDGLRLGQQAAARVWTEVLRRSHRRGELFVLMFHPEAFELCSPVFEAVLREARDLHPRVWLAQLRDVSRWWREKAAFEVKVRSEGSRGLRLDFVCSSRATVLLRNVETDASTRSWPGNYRVLDERTLHASGSPRPFVGVSADVPPAVADLVREQGYITETGDTAVQCAVYLDGKTAAALATEVGIVNFIEDSQAPLVRFWRWPSEAGSALCLTGDLDALSLRDYLGRLIGR